MATHRQEKPRSAGHPLFGERDGNECQREALVEMQQKGGPESFREDAAGGAANQDASVDRSILRLPQHGSDWDLSGDAITLALSNLVRNRYPEFRKQKRYHQGGVKHTEREKRGVANTKQENPKKFAKKKKEAN